MASVVTFHMDNGQEVKLTVDSESTATGMRKAFIAQQMITFTDSFGDVKVINSAKAAHLTINHNSF
mgnify:CR=1 FL=1